MITLIDKYGFVKQLQIVLPPGTVTYKMACFPETYVGNRGYYHLDHNAAYAPSMQTRTFHRQGTTNVFEER